MLADVFNSRLFETTQLTAAINNQPFLPNYLGELGIFEESGVETTTVFVEVENETLSLVPATPRGSPGTPGSSTKRDGVAFAAPRLMVSDALLADEVQNVRAFGSEDQLLGVEQKRDQKLAKAARDLDLTLEYHRLGAIQGVVLDASGSTIYDLYSKFGLSAHAPISLELDQAAGTADIRARISAVRRAIFAALGGHRGMLKGVVSLCGDDLWDALTNHDELRATYLNQAAANDLREGDTLESFTFGGFRWVNYQGYGDVKIAAAECRFVPIGVPELFKTTFVPADYMEAVNTIGLPRYTKAEPMRMNRGIELESQSNPITICTRPTALIKGTLT
jgi:hypothetical protein